MEGPRSNREIYRVSAVVAVCCVFAAWVTLYAWEKMRGSRDGSRGSTMSGPDCPELAAYDPALAALPVEELERRLRTSGLLPGFAVENQLAGMRAALEQYRPEKRRCMYKVMLVGSVATARALVKTMPGLWGLDRPSHETAALFRTAALRRSWTPGERNDLLAQIEEIFLPSLHAESDADREHWRRQYYSLLLTCEATDEELARLGAPRPHDCLGLTPRRAK